MSWTDGAPVPSVDVVLAAPALVALASGLLLGLGLIVAVGAQNTFVLRQGLRVEHVAAVVAVCTVSDLALITAGVLGAGTAVSRAPWLISALRFLGATFLTWYGLRAARRAFRPAILAVGDQGPPTRATITVGTCLALTWLNPHVYLDTVLLLGSTASTYGRYRWQFGAGAALGSTIWFTGLGYGARLLRPIFARAAAWRVLDTAVAVVMAVLAVSLTVQGFDGT
jgi:L-lysine exporter family protein LysE/ArgO